MKTLEDGARAAKSMMEEEKHKKTKLEKDLEELIELLHDGPVDFKYEKKDGSIREAHGTLKSDLMPKDAKEDKRRYTKSDDVVYYYDIEAEGFRSFRKENYKGLIK